METLGKDLQKRTSAAAQGKREDREKRGATSAFQKESNMQQKRKTSAHYCCCTMDAAKNYVDYSLLLMYMSRIV
jgi:PAB1-binding protein PBP1